uniref:Endonuclease/exonuclease/phosphatase domain-containing protein n=1 Tax=Latimeria chalumnae TaxID=7897 RepID=H3A334_LATCH
RMKIHGFHMIACRYHAKYGIATYVRDDLATEAEEIMQADNFQFTITVRVGKLTIMNVYKPPLETWPTIALPTASHPSIYIGDFNSHHHMWGYQKADRAGEQLEDWALASNVHLVFDAKQPGTFFSAHWQKEYSPDLCFMTSDSKGQPLNCSWKILKNFPHSQHRPSILHVGIEVPIVNSVPKPRWNFRKALWPTFTSIVEETIQRIPPSPNNYSRFAQLLKVSATKSIPRGYRTEYIPCWSKESERLLAEYNITQDMETATALLDSLDEDRLARWQEITENLDFSHSSRKPWNLLCWLGAASQTTYEAPKVSADAVVANLLVNSKILTTTESKRRVKKLLKLSLQKAAPHTTFSTAFTTEEVNTVLTATKSGKASGVDGIYPEFLKNLGPKGQIWLAKFASNIL